MTKCILVVEDQEDNRQILRDLLGNAGYELTEAENGEEAIAAVARRRPGPHPYGHPTANYGRLRGHPAD
jgi:CheY-like chemotaxis protein